MCRWGSRVNSGGVLAINSLLPLWLVRLPWLAYGGARERELAGGFIVMCVWALPCMPAQCGSRQPTLSSSLRTCGEGRWDEGASEPRARMVRDVRPSSSAG